MGDDEDSRSEERIYDNSRFEKETDDYNSGDTYRWECPICHMKGVATVRNPAQVLRTHIFETGGGGHDDRGTFPEEFPEGEGVDEFISRVG